MCSHSCAAGRLKNGVVYHPSWHLEKNHWGFNVVTSYHLGDMSVHAVRIALLSNCVWHLILLKLEFLVGVVFTSLCIYFTSSYSSQLWCSIDILIISNVCLYLRYLGSQGISGSFNGIQYVPNAVTNSSYLPAIITMWDNFSFFSK